MATSNIIKTKQIDSIDNELDYDITDIIYPKKLNSGDEISYPYNNIVENIAEKMLEINKELDPHKKEEDKDKREEDKDKRENLLIESKSSKVHKKKSIVRNVKAAIKINENTKEISHEKKLDKWKKIRDRKKAETLKKKPLIESKKPHVQNNISTLIEDISENDRRNQKELMEYIGKKMDNISETIKNRPDAYKFDVKRDNQGYISTVLVKPDK